MYFTGFTPTSNLPDFSTINKFRNLLIEKRKYKKLFKELNKQLELLGLSINNAKGAIIDATLVESADRPDKYMDNLVEDRKEDKSTKPNILCGKDTNVRWIKKGKKSYYGYKVFASVDDDEHGFIQTIHTESAEVYDTTANRELLKTKRINNRILQKALST